MQVHVHGLGELIDVNIKDDVWNVQIELY